MLKYLNCAKYTLAQITAVFHSKFMKKHKRTHRTGKNLRKKAKVIWKLTRFGLSYKRKKISSVSSQQQIKKRSVI